MNRGGFGVSRCQGTGKAVGLRFVAEGRSAWVDRLTGGRTKEFRKPIKKQDLRFCSIQWIMITGVEQRNSHRFSTKSEECSMENG